MNGQCPLLALSGHPGRVPRCPLSGVKRTSGGGIAMSVIDPKRTLRLNRRLDCEPYTQKRYGNTLGTARKLDLTAYIRSRAWKETHMMISRARQEVPVWSMDSSFVTVLGLPPKDPDDDDDEDDEDDEDEGEEEPAVVREPDE
jgi:hypothetical protein